MDPNALDGEFLKEGLTLSYPEDGTVREERAERVTRSSGAWSTPFVV